MAIQALQQQISNLALQANAQNPKTMSKVEKDSFLDAIRNFKQSVNIETENNNQTRGSVTANVRVIFPINSDSQTSQLPIEVITIIFNVVIGKIDIHIPPQGPVPPQKLQEILGVETVCKQWQAIIKTVPAFNFLKNKQILVGLSKSLLKMELPYQTIRFYIKTTGLGTSQTKLLEIGRSSSIGDLKEAAAASLNIPVNRIKHCVLSIDNKSISFSDDAKLTDPKIAKSISNQTVVNLVIL